MTIHDQLYDKLSSEFTDFIDGLKMKLLDEIIDSAYEKVIKADILMWFEYNSLNDKQAAALLAMEEPLNKLYQGWMDSDASYMDDLRDCILDTVNREIDDACERKEDLLKEYPLCNTVIDTIAQSEQMPQINANVEEAKQSTQEHAANPINPARTKTEPPKKESFGKRLNDGKEKVAAYKIQKTQEPINLETNHKKKERN